ncbi:MAG: YciI family protein [Phascolarctobacterium sp.]|nr:YciI family protein [Phascolarctobacterium sp.]
MQFIINAYDGTDAKALDRRMAARPEHLENMKKVQEIAKVLCAGGLLNAEGKMIGSFLVMDFATQELFDKYLESEPYIKHGVWEKVQVERCNAVIVNNEKVGN